MRLRSNTNSRWRTLRPLPTLTAHFCILWPQHLEKSWDDEARNSVVYVAVKLEFVLPDNQPPFPFGIPAKERLELINGSFSDAYPVKETRDFDDLLMAIDEADAGLGTAHERGGEEPPK